MTNKEIIKIINNIPIDYCKITIKQAEQIDEALSLVTKLLYSISRERIEKVWRGKWAFKSFYKGTSRGAIECQKCKSTFEGSVGFNFCPHCGSPMTDEAVQMVMERLEVLKDGNTTD